MKNKDTHSLSSLYEQVLTGNKLLNEEIPPTELTGREFDKTAYDALDTSEESNPAGRKRATYPRIATLDDASYRELIYRVGMKVMQLIAASPDKVFPGEREELVKKIVEFINEIIPGNFPPSHLPFVARQILRQLETPTGGAGARAIGVVRDISPRVRGGRSKKDVEGVASKAASVLKPSNIPGGPGGAPKISP